MMGTHGNATGIWAAERARLGITPPLPKLFAVFCTVNVLPAKLDMLLSSAYKQYPLDDGAALSIITSGTASNNLRMSEAPMTTFDSPFQHKTMAELRRIYAADFTDRHWGDDCFVVLDEKFIADGTVVLVSTDPHWYSENIEDEDELESWKNNTQMLNHRCDGQICLDLLVEYDNNHDCGEAWHAEDDVEAWNYVVTTDEHARMMGAGR